MKFFTKSILTKLSAAVAIAVVSSTSVIAQSPESFKYQTAVRNASGEPIVNEDVSFEISIVKTSTVGLVVYAETHLVTTNAYGLANLNVGGGTTTIGTFENIEWGTDDYFLQVAFDENAGSNFTILGATQLLSVPYALYAKNVENDNVDDADADATNEIQSLSLDGTDLSISGNIGTVDLSSLVDDADADPSNEIQTLSLNGSNLSVSGGNTVDLSPVADGGLFMLEINGSNTGDTISSEVQYVKLNGNQEVVLPPSPSAGDLLYFTSSGSGSSVNFNGEDLRDGSAFLGKDTRTFGEMNNGAGGALIMLFDGFNWNIISKN